MFRDDKISSYLQFSILISQHLHLGHVADTFVQSHLLEVHLLQSKTSDQW